MNKIFSSKGRIGRKDYIVLGILNFLFHFSILYLIIYFSNKINIFNDSLFFILIVFLLLPISFFLFYLPATVKRFHDIGVDGWGWMIIIFVLIFIASSFFSLYISFIVYIVLAMIKEQDGSNKYGPDPRDKKQISRKNNEN